MKELPLVSIVTVVFNGDTYLQNTISSVANQTYSNIEYIIIDGGSTDNTIEIIKANTKYISNWVSEPDKGLYDAMNKGIKRAKGELIGIINSDDWYEPNAVEVVVEAYLSNRDKKIFHSDRYDVYPKGERKKFPFNPSVFKFKFLAMTYNHPSMFVASVLYDDYNYNTNLKVCSDYQFVLTSFLKDRNQFAYIKKATVNFRLGGLSGQIPLNKLLKELYLARRNAGMSIFSSIFAGLCKLGFETIKFILKRPNFF